MHWLNPARMKWMLLAGLTLASILFLAYDPLDYPYPQVQTPASFTQYLNTRGTQDENASITIQSQDILIRFSKQKTNQAILYLSDFAQSPKQIQQLLKSLSRKANCNIYAPQLIHPAESNPNGDLQKTSTAELLQSTATALAAMPLLGHNTVVMGSGMGANLATWLAYEKPNQVQSLILVAPYFNYANGWQVIAEYPGGSWLLDFMQTPSQESPALSSNQKNRALKPVQSRAFRTIRKLVNRDLVFKQIRQPVLMLYYYKNEDEQDPLASVAAMQSAFNKFGTMRSPENQIRAHPLNRVVALPEGGHKILEYKSQTFQARMLEILNVFLRDVVRFNA